jgi:hypothetical protein
MSARWRVLYIDRGRRAVVGRGGEARSRDQPTPTSVNSRLIWSCREQTAVATTTGVQLEGHFACTFNPPVTVYIIARHFLSGRLRYQQRVDVIVLEAMLAPSVANIHRDDLEANDARQGADTRETGVVNFPPGPTSHRAK